MQVQAEELRAELKREREENDRLRIEIRDLNQRLDDLFQQIDRMKNSIGWRILTPFRAVGSFFSGLSVVISSKVETVIPLRPGVVGLYFLIPIVFSSYYSPSKNSMVLLESESFTIAFL